MVPPGLGVLVLVDRRPLRSLQDSRTRQLLRVRAPGYSSVNRSGSKKNVKQGSDVVAVFIEEGREIRQLGAEKPLLFILL